MIVVGTQHECEMVRRLFAKSVHRLGADAPEWMRSPTFALTVIADHSTPSATTSVVIADDLEHDAPMTHAEAARAAQVSTSTIGRRVADETLERVGRRVSAASVRRWIAGGGEHPARGVGVVDDPPRGQDRRRP